GKEYFTIYDFVDAYHHFLDPEWDGEPIDETTEKEPKGPKTPCDPIEKPPVPPKIKIKLRDGKEREIQHMIATTFWSADGKPMSAEEFLRSMFGALPEFFKSEDELRKIWSNPNTRKALLEKLASAGYGADDLASFQKMINAEKSDLFDVLEYISFALPPITREMRVAQAQSKIFEGLDNKQKEFVEFVLSKYIETGVEELDQEKLPDLLTLKYQAISDAEEILGGVENIRNTFIGFQKYLYEKV
ncbi:MAG: restriction endonuclease subunit R, partial [Candidatus Omnitrophica bacterium]|nr:restriction endonuclease subunit R [Candidatus Omnitrophota bacterium]